MENYFYIVTRLFYKGSAETHSVQILTDRRQATQRFYNTIAADLADNDVTYQFASIVDCYGNPVDGIKPVIYDRRPTPAE